MILGIDVGGTRTDTVLISEKGILSASKTDTTEDLLETIQNALEEALDGVDPKGIRRAVFSTTLATNAVVQDRLAPTAMLVMAGPGIDPSCFEVGPSYHVIDGVLDHQGFEVIPVNRRQVEEKIKVIRSEGIGLLGVAGKFSPRNPEHEQKVYEISKEAFEYISLGHRFSGLLNFPRRIATTYLNSALYPIQRRFVESLSQILAKKGIYCNRFLLKPDGGTYSLESSLHMGVAAAQSGPAASVMGAICLDGCKGTSLVMDIGGTTTDMAIVVDGMPLLAPTGAQIGPFKTMIRSLYTRSVGIGGDSVVYIDSDQLKIGPQRLGPPAAFGGQYPTPTDAMVCLGLLDEGSVTKAHESLKPLGEALGIQDIKELAKRILKTMAEIIYSHAQEFLEEINSRPVYTIHEVLYEKRIEPDALVIIGGPALQLALYVSEAFGLPYRVPRLADVANAVGAAVSKVTAEISLYADTQKGTLIIPEVEHQERIPYTFREQEALEKGKEALIKLANLFGAEGDLEIQVTERQVFNMVKGFYRTGQNMRMRMGLRPGILHLGGCTR